MVRDRGCVFPGCRHTKYLHCHHIEHWLHGGETKVDNLAMTCSFHHHLVHEGGWRISRADEDTGDGPFVFHSPSGIRLEPSPPREWVEDVTACMEQWAEEHDLELDPEVNRPQWDGRPPDYNAAVGFLLEGD